MTDNLENMTLELLKRLQITLESVQRDVRDLKVRQADTHGAVLALRRDSLSDAEATAHMQSQMDRFGDRLDRIERRLELND